MGSGASTSNGAPLETVWCPDRVSKESAKAIVDEVGGTWDEKRWLSFSQLEIDDSISKQTFIAELHRGQDAVMVATEKKEPSPQEKKLFRMIGLVRSRDHLDKLWKKLDFKKKGHISLMQVQRIVMFPSRVWKLERLRGDKRALLELYTLECAAGNGKDPTKLSVSSAALKVQRDELARLVRDIAIHVTVAQRSATQKNVTSAPDGSGAATISGPAVRILAMQLGVAAKDTIGCLAPFALDGTQGASTSETAAAGWATSYGAHPRMSRAMARVVFPDKAMDALWGVKKAATAAVPIARLKSAKASNADYFLAPAKVAYYEGLFHKYDKDGDEEISVDEFQAMFDEEFNAYLEHKTILKMVNQYDIDNNGTIEIFEFLNMMADREHSMATSGDGISVLHDGLVKY